MRDNYNNNWRERLTESEVKPPSRVWESLDARLNSRDAAKYRKQAHIYKVAAAIALVFSAAMAYLNVSDLLTERAGPDVALTRDVVEDNSTLPVPALELTDEQLSATADKVVSPAAERTPKAPEKETLRASVFPVTADADMASEGVGIVGRSQNEFVFPLANAIAPQLHASVQHKVSIHKVDMAAKLFDEEKVEETPKDKLYLAGLSLASGRFDPNYQNQVQPEPSNIKQPFLSSREAVNPSADAMSSETLVKNSVKEPDYEPSQMLAAHLKFGINITPRLGLSSGLGYGEYSTRISSNAIYETDENKLIPLNTFNRNAVQNAYNDEGVIIPNENYTTINNFRLMTIPVEINYAVLNTRLFAQVKAGLHTNVYLGYTMKDDERYFDKVRIESGTDSPYRDLSFNYVFGGVIGYRLAKMYAITVEPSVIQSIGTFSRQNASFSSRPTMLSLSAGLQFYF